MRKVKAERSRVRHSCPSVLIVEDDATVAQAAAAAIEAVGYHTIWVRDGWQALQELKQAQPAVFLVDLSLPGMSGSEFLRILRNNPTWSRIPRVIMTGTNDPMIGVREDAPVFYKPLDINSLVAAVERYCDRSHPGLSAFRVGHS
jgi:CheY-like chemotaxis protein